MQNTLFDKITNILKKGAEERGATEKVVVSNTPLWKGISIDMPKRYKEMYHGLYSKYYVLNQNFGVK